MDANGGCCVGRYATRAHDMSKVDRIMLRFRPIAPKPVAGSTASGASQPESIDAFCSCGRGRRKFVKVQKSPYINIDNNSSERCNRRRKYSPGQNHLDPVVTLPLLPETPDHNDFPAIDLPAPPATDVQNKVTKPVWLSFENLAPPGSYYNYGTNPDRPRETPTGSVVTVECVTDTWVEGDGLGSTDEERMVNLSKDTCPGFISDGMGWVTWTNGSYRKMVGQEGKETETVTVWLVMKEKLVGMWYHRSFTCRVKVQYTCGKESGSLTLPCDVWRMDNGGFAWRLDVKAALSLGHGSVMIPYLT